MKHCPICGDPSLNKNGGLCSPCTSWHYATRDLTPNQKAAYAERFANRLRRAQGRSPLVRRMRRPHLRVVGERR